MSLETFELTKKWSQWADKTSKKIKSTKLSKAIVDYADLAFKSYQFRGLKWYKEALEALTNLQEIVDDVIDKFETDKDANTQLVLASLDKGKNVVPDAKAEITKDEKEYKSAVEKQKKVAEQLELVKTKLSKDSHTLVVKAGKLRELVAGYKEENVKQLEIWQKGAQHFKDQAQQLVEPIKLLKKRLSIEAELAKDSTVLDDRADIWLLAEKCSSLKFAEEHIKETEKIANEVHETLETRIVAAIAPKTKAPPLPKKE